MAQIPRQLILGLGLMALIASAQAGGFRLWAELSPLEQAALAPIASDWNHLPAQQQEKLIKVAKGFTKLTPKQRQVLHARLVNWTRMTPEQRKALIDMDQKAIVAMGAHPLAPFLALMHIQRMRKK